MKTPSRTFLLAIAFVAAVSLNSCKKDKANGNENTEATLLASGTWKLSRIEYQKKSDGTWVDKPLEPGVEVTMSFKGDKTVVVVSPTESAVRSWVLSDDSSQLTIASSSGKAFTSTVLELTGATLKLSPLAFSSTIYSAERDTFSH
jgi:hypothetical protein